MVGHRFFTVTFYVTVACLLLTGCDMFKEMKDKWWFEKKEKTGPKRTPVGNPGGEIGLPGYGEPRVEKAPMFIPPPTPYPETTFTTPPSQESTRQRVGPPTPQYKSQYPQFDGAGGSYPSFTPPEKPGEVQPVAPDNTVKTQPLPTQPPNVPSGANSQPVPGAGSGSPFAPVNTPDATNTIGKNIPYTVEGELTNEGQTNKVIQYKFDPHFMPLVYDYELRQVDGSFMLAKGSTDYPRIVDVPEIPKEFEERDALEQEMRAMLKEGEEDSKKSGAIQKEMKENPPVDEARKTTDDVNAPAVVPEVVEEEAMQEVVDGVPEPPEMIDSLETE